MERKIIHGLFIASLLAALLRAQENVGVPVDGYPDWYERTVFTATNSCRISPQQYRDSLIGDTTFLKVENYPAVEPVIFNLDLSKAARYHSVDMKTCGKMQHNSCDGTAWNTRIQSYYTASSSIGEIIGYGNSTGPFTMVNVWLVDDLPEDSTQTSGNGLPNPDGVNDIHRQIIMSAGYQDIGSGHSSTSATSQTTHYWTQDFGGADRILSHPMAGGGTHFNKGDSTWFWVNYYSTTNQVPQEVIVVIEGFQYQLEKYLGTESRGTYTLVHGQISNCREYYFRAVDEQGITWYYPEDGVFLTYGENCTINYGVATDTRSAELLTRQSIKIPFDGTVLTLPGDLSSEGVTVELFTLKGQLLFQRHTKNGQLQIPNSVVGTNLFCRVTGGGSTLYTGVLPLFHQ